VLERGLARFADAPAPELAEALLYRAELAARLGRAEVAAASLAAEFTHAAVVVDDRGRARRSGGR
jgi:hypothetical protein